MKERIRWIDNAKGICVFCVLLAHCKLHHPYIQMVYTPVSYTHLDVYKRQMQKRPYSREERFHAMEKELLKPLKPEPYEMRLRCV